MHKSHGRYFFLRIFISLAVLYRYIMYSIAVEAMLWLFSCKTHGSTCLCVVPLCWHTMSLINYIVWLHYTSTHDAQVHNTQTYAKQAPSQHHSRSCSYSTSPDVDTSNPTSLILGNVMKYLFYLNVHLLKLMKWWSKHV